MTIDIPRTIAVWAEASRAGDGEAIMGDTTSQSGLPWPRIPADLRHFREVTRDHVLIMGRTTYEKLPAELKRPASLAERPIIVLTRGRLSTIAEETVYTGAIRPVNPGNTTEAQVLLYNLQYLPEYEGKDVAVIAGAKVIELFEPFYSELHVTAVRNDRYHGDALAPSDAFFDQFVTDTRVDLADRVTAARLVRKTPKEN